MSQSNIRISKFLSLVLRHEPEKAGLVPDSAGWVAVDDLLRGCARAGVRISPEQLETVVAENDKQRFAFSPDRQRIRANQGHSIEVELAYAPSTPPEMLFHGTADRFLAAIQTQGLVKAQRHHVHLTADIGVAQTVGRRHGRPVVLRVSALAMQQAGHVFFLSANGVWLTEQVPPQYLAVVE